MFSTHDAHAWHFDRLGGFDQVRLASDADWQALPELDAKLWAVLSCPVSQLALDTRTLSLLDRDGDGRVRVIEVKEAVSWVCERLSHPAVLKQRSALIRLDDLREDTQSGEALRQAALAVLEQAEQADRTVLTLEVLEQVMARFANRPFNGDGVITRETTNDALLQAALSDVQQCVGSVTDLSGLSGVDESLLDVFEQAVADRLSWQQQAQAAGAFVLGESTLSALQALDAVQAKVDDFFTRVALCGFDAQAVTALNPASSSYEAMSAVALDARHAAIAGLPLAQVSPQADLPLLQGINPAWQGAMTRFVQTVVVPLMGDKSHLTLPEWQDLVARLALARDWQAQQQGVQVSALASERLQAWSDQRWGAQLRELIARDLMVADQRQQMDALLKLLLFVRDLDQVVNNFVSLRDFYSPDHLAAFEAGTLYLDGRSMRLCLTVDNVSAHAPQAVQAGTFLLYCDCVRRGGTDKMSVVCAVTAGHADQLAVGRHGVFYDRHGDEWDAVVVRMVEHPISVAEAFWSPYKRLARLIANQLEKFASARDKAVEAKASEAVGQVAKEAKPGDKPAAPFDIAKFAGIFAALGLALGAVGTAIATLLASFLALSWWEMPIAVAGLLLLVSGPAMLLAWLKLRKRSLGPILDANGWAVNAHASISLPFGATLTQVASLPKGSHRSLRDPFAQKSRAGWWWLLAMLLLLSAAAKTGSVIQMPDDSVKQQP